ncbi:FAD/NAD(P)-binding protein [Virgisporangium ochraceum]|uniref:Pyridine nucleotide-disulfide oxidoreductase n=1 Tax=Virgisporangium ochraceum TaxID=65505 RepID=A0A8J4EBA4_9ACTN|nr:FAD/NAD(P)-binding protein [Virgisporangium ochraceum]GIJ68248.1 pyridine nucleotide-disulfide oxidoreductase [Virgisporangium ochraceum]
MGSTTFVIGGGCSGTLAAIHLLRSTGHRVVLAEPRPTLGGGVAYGTTDPGHLLNSRAGTMSVSREHPTDFVEWCRRRDPEVHDGSFAPRRWYGEYLRDRLQEAALAHPGRLEVHSGRVTGVRLARSAGPVVVTADGREVATDAAVLAVGHAAPTDPAWACGLRGSPRYVSDPWSGAEVPTDGPVLLVGTGLTAVDVALSLAPRADLVALSRRGLLPLSHVDSAGEPCAPVPLDGERIAPLMRRIRQAAAAGPDWRAAFDALRPATDDVWRSLPPASRERFLRHAARWWDVHRHRMAPPIAAEVARLTASGRLRVSAARVEHAAAGPRGVSVTVDGRARRFAAVVNCTGPGSPLRHPLVADLVAAGTARSGPHGLGLDTDEAGRLTDHAGRPWRAVHVLGPARRGRLWETTAVPEIRAHAEELALASAPGPALASA